MKFIDIVGQRFNKLTVIERLENNKYNQTMWLCRCDCGEEAKVEGGHLKSGHTKSCGCHKIDKFRERFITHGNTIGGERTKEYIVWENIKNRCLNSNNNSYKNYGGRGIAICDEWLDFSNFYHDVGPCPGLGYTIERIDNNKGYSKDNFKWATKKEQARNRRSNRYIEYGGKKQLAQDWASDLGVSNTFITSRIYKNIPFPEIAKQAKEYVFKKHWHEDLMQSDYENEIEGEEKCL